MVGVSVVTPRTPLRWMTIIGTWPPPYVVPPARSPPLPVTVFTGAAGTIGESQQPLMSLGPNGASSAKLPSSQVTKIAEWPVQAFEFMIAVTPVCRTSFPAW